MKIKGKRFIVLLLTFAMVLSQMSFAAFAVDSVASDDSDQAVTEQAVEETQPDAETQADAVQAEPAAEPEKAEAVEEPAETEPVAETAAEPEKTEPAAEPAKAETKKAEPKKEEPKEEAFNQSKTVSGVTVRVKAAEGVFPAGSELSVSKASVPSAVDTEDAAEAYAFDISILADGKKIQPDGNATVSFTTAEVAKYDTEVYHMDGNNAEELNVSESGRTASVKTDGFSVYVITFSDKSDPSYTGAKTYEMQEGEKILLDTLYQQLGISETVNFHKTSLDGDGKDLFSFIEDPNNVYIKAVGPFTKDTTAILVFKNGSDQIVAKAYITVKKVEDEEIEAPTAIKGLVYNGKPLELIEAGSTPTGTMQYKVAGSGSDWNADIPTGTNAGTSTVEYRVVLNNPDSVIASGSVEATIAKDTAKVTTAPTPRKETYRSTGWKLVLPGTADANGTMQYALGSTDSEVAPTEGWSEDRPTGTAVGKYRVWYKAKAKDENNYNDSTPAWVDAEILPAGTITVTLPTTKAPTYNGDEQELINTETGGASEGFKLTYRLKPEEETDEGWHVVSPVGTDAGNYTVEYMVVTENDGQEFDYSLYSFVDEEGNAIDPKGTFDATIEQLEAELSWNYNTKKYDGKAHLPKATVTNLKGGDTTTTVKVSRTGAGTNVGKYTSTATELTGTRAFNYKLPADPTHNWEITQSDEMPMPEVALEDWTYGAPKDPTVTNEDDFADFDDVTFTFEYAVKGTNEFSGNKPTAVGTYKVRAVATDNTGNYSVKKTSPSVTFRIVEKALNVTIENKSKVYGSADPALTYTVEGIVPGEEQDSIITGTLEREEGEDAGEYAIKADETGFIIKDKNYTLGTVTNGVFTIEKKPVHITWSNMEQTYTGEPLWPTAKVTLADGRELYDTIEPAFEFDQNGKVKKAIKAGEYTAIAYLIDKKGTQNKNYQVIDGSDREAFTILKAELDPVVQIDGWVYGDTVDDGGANPSETNPTVSYGDVTPDPEPVVTYTYYTDRACHDKTTAADGAAVKGGYPTFVGTYYVKATVAGTDNTYAAESRKGAEFSITPAELTVTADRKDKTYGEADPAFTYVVDENDLKYSDTKDVVTGALTREEGEDAGFYKITQGTLDAGENYTIEYVSHSLHIHRANLVATPKPVEVIYGEEAVGAGFTVEGLVERDWGKDNVINEDGIKYSFYNEDSSEYEPGDDVTTEGVVVLSGLKAKNYNISYAPGVLTVASRPVTTVWSTPDKFTYDAKAHKVEVVDFGDMGLFEGDKNNKDNLDVAYVDNEKTDAGEYKAVASLTGTKAANYIIKGSTQEHPWSIGKATLTVTATDQTIYNTDDYNKTAVSYAGFAGGDTEAVLTAKPTVSSDYYVNAKAGKYTLTPSGAAAKNYTFRYANGTLTVNEKGTVLVARGRAKGGNTINVSWTNYTGADRYVVYYGICGKTPMKYYKAVWSNTRSLDVTGLSRGTKYKFYVYAQKNVNGSFVNIARSNGLHVIAGNVSGGYTNPSRVVLSRYEGSMPVGGKYKIKASVSKAVPGRDLLGTNHDAQLTYRSSNNNVAKVSKNGVVYAVGKGTCRIYVMSISGVYSTMVLTVH